MWSLGLQNWVRFSFIIFSIHTYWSSSLSTYFSSIICARSLGKRFCPWSAFSSLLLTGLWALPCLHQTISWMTTSQTVLRLNEDLWCFSVFDKFDGNKCVVSEWVSLKYSSRWKQQKYWYWNACKILMRTGTEQQEDWMDWLLRAVYAKTIKLLLKMLSSSSSILVYIHRLTSIS